MLRCFVSAKIHGLRVTDKSLDYNGSASIDRRLMEEVGLLPHEQVQVVNMNNGQRWTTYAIPSDEPGYFSLNGAAARLGELGDVCIVMAYAFAEKDPEAKVVFCDAQNRVRERTRYLADNLPENLADNLVEA
jgi:aspartate 1-decarboxylase